MNYRRVSPTGEKSYGIGLLLCRKFAQRMGGDIEVISEFGAGSTFRLSIPKRSLPSNLNSKDKTDVKPSDFQIN